MYPSYRGKYLKERKSRDHASASEIIGTEPKSAFKTFAYDNA